MKNLNSNVLTMYSKTNCVFCDRAAALLDSFKIPFSVVKVDDEPTAREFLMSEGHRAVPQLYLNGKLFVEGGYAGLVKLGEAEIKNKLINL